MTTAAASTEYHDASLLARLDSQDVHFSNGLRQYLSSRGMRVVGNYESPIRTHYHIICGDNQFVKTILTTFGAYGDRVLVISWDESTKTNPKLGNAHVRLVLTDRDITSDDVTAILHFFFTGSSPLLDIRGKATKALGEDKERIAELIDDIYEREKPRFPKHGTRRYGWGRALISVLALPLFWYIATLGTSITAYGVSLMLLARGDSGAATKAAFVGTSAARAGRVLVSAAGITSQESMFSLLVDTGSVLIRLGEVSRDAKAWATNVLSDQVSQGQSPVVAADDLRSRVGAIVTNIGLLQASFDQLIGANIFPVRLLRFGQFDEKIRTRITEARLTLGSVDQFLLLYKEGGGFAGTQTYLVLFQNSMELRPTGGFIGSVGKLTMVDGRIVDLTIFDVYELDGQLRGHVDPPEPIRTLMSQEHWYLRDSNWDPDFASTASRARWFYEKETGSGVDGVIGVTTAFISHLLGATGPITLTDYDDTVTSDNFLGKALYYTKSDFFPGSTQKKDFLGSLARALFERMRLSRVGSAAALNALVSSVGNRDLQFYFVDPLLERMTQEYGWAGAVGSKSHCDGDTESISCVDLPLSIIDANVGVNKANFFVSNEISRDIELTGSGTVIETVTFSQSNSGGTGGEDANYKSYTRFYLPPLASVGRVVIDGVATREGRGDTLPYWEAGNEHERVVVGVASTLAPKQTRRIGVTYTHPIVTTSEVRMVVVTRGQAGVSTTPFFLRARAPSSWLLELSGDRDPRQLVASSGTVEYNTTLSRDIGLNLRLTQ